MSRLLEDARNRLPIMLADLEALVRCESPSGDLEALAESAEELSRLSVVRTGAVPERLGGDPPVLRWRFSGSAQTRILLLGHHDTVWPVGSIEKIPWRVTGDRIQGPGCFDMKAGIVQLFHALALLPDLGGITVLLTGDEEVGSPGSRPIIEHEAGSADAVLVLEPSGEGGAVKIARKGAAFYRLRVTGRPAHAGLEPERGVNATLELAHQTLVISRLADAAAGTSVTPTTVRSGCAANVVPADAELMIDVRSRTAEEQDRVDRALQRLEPILAGSALDLCCESSRPPLEERSGLSLLGSAMRAARTLGLADLSTARVGGASDGNLAAGVGARVLDGLGPRGGGAHADDEHVLVSDLAPRAALLASLITRVREEHDADRDPLTERTAP